MNIYDILILILLATAAAGALYALRGGHRCCGGKCSGCCEACTKHCRHKH